jgi:uncharacterized protein (TIGR02646 family)
MIPVKLEPEPEGFDEKVRMPGRNWLRDHGINPDGPPPDPSKLPAYWRETMNELWTAYQGVCAYLCIYFELSSGAATTDHFVAKSRNAGQAYEWSNYRLSCFGMNSNKNRFADILDPFEIEPDTFILEFPSGGIKPNPALSHNIKSKAEATIRRLQLDASMRNQMRARHLRRYQEEKVSEAHLREESPFVWYEARRQGLL